MAESRVKKSLKNAKINLVFFGLTLILTFFSRKIFLDYLGADFIGLVGTLQTILGFLSLAELGVGTAISFHLYKPVQSEDREEINRLVSLFGFYYRFIGSVILGAGVIVSAFLPMIFIGKGVELAVVFCAYFAFLFSSLFGYFINYRSILLTADQRNYVVNGFFQTSNICKNLMQMLLIYYTKSLYVWIIVELIFAVLNSIILNWKIDKTYPWLKSSAALGRRIRKDYPHILTSVKQVFIHRIKDFFLQQSDQILIFAFVSLKMVAYYGNYTLLITKVSAVFSTAFDGIFASVGNLVAEGNKGKMLKVFWELMALKYFVAGLVIVPVWFLIEPFITIWLGEEYVLSIGVLFIIICNSFISLTRGTIDMFNNAYGHYADIWAAWTEGIINVIFTLLLGWKFGLIGIIGGKLISLIPIVVIWKPLYLFRDGFKERYWKYWRGTLRYYLCIGIGLASVALLYKVIPIDPTKGYLEWIVYAVAITLIFLVPYISSFIIIAPGARDLLARLPIKRFKRLNIK